MKKSLKKFIVALSAGILACFFGGTMNFLDAQASTEQKTLDEITVTMQKGAAVRYSSDYAQNGLRYVLEMTKSDYEGLTLNNDDVSFGIFIAPADYETKYGELNEKNLLTTPVYGWVDKNADGTYPEYTGDKTEIIHLSSSVMGEVDGVMCWYGSIINLKQENRNREFIGVGYVKDGDTYKFAERNDNVRSMTYVAQLAQQDDKLSTTAKQNLTNTYITDYATTDVNYSVEYVYDNGTTVEKVLETTGTAKLNSEITYNPDATLVKDGLLYNTQETQLKSVAYAHDKTVMQVQYKVPMAHSMSLANATVENKSVSKDGMKVYSALNALSVETSDEGLTATASGNTQWNGLKIDFTDLKPNTEYILRFKMIGESGKLFHLNADYSKNGVSYDGGLYSLAYTNDNQFYQPTEDGTEVLVCLSTPNVQFDKATVSIQSRQTDTYSYTIPEIDLTEDAGVSMITVENTPFAWESNKAVAGTSCTLKADQSILAGDVVWASSNSDVATVENGTVNFLSSGKVEITATLGDKVAYANFVVYNEDNSYVKTSNNLSLVYEANSPADFNLNLASGTQLKVLQISDPQIADMAQIREDRTIGGGSEVLWADRTAAVYTNLEKTIQTVNPDLILVAGDIIYGEFDDNGSILKEFVAFMENQKIFWAPVYGNHDNESDMGVAWQNRQFLNAEYCLFNRGNVTGNGNYSISVQQDGTYLSNIYMLDTNGCIYSRVGDNCEQGLYQSTVDWMQNIDAELSTYQNATTKDVVCMHIPVQNAYKAYEALGFSTTSLDVNFDTDTSADSFGHIVASSTYMENTSDYEKDYDLTSIFATMGVTNAQFGHCHKTNASAIYEGVRYTFGLKAGIIPDYNQGETGGTVLTLGDTGYKVAHHYDTYAETNTLEGFTDATGFNVSNTVRTENGYRFAYKGTGGWSYVKFNTPYTLSAGKTYTLTMKMRVHSMAGNVALSNFYLYDTVNAETYKNAWSVTDVSNVYEQTLTITATEDVAYWVGFACNYKGEEASYDLEYFDVVLEEVVPDLFLEKITANSASHGNVNYTTTKTSGEISVDTVSTATAHKITLKTKHAITADTTYQLSFKVSDVVLNNTATTANINFYLYSTSGYKDLSKFTDGNVTDTFTAKADGNFELVIYFNAASAGVSFTISDFKLQEDVFDTASTVNMNFSETVEGGVCTLAGSGGWNTVTPTTNFTLGEGKTYTVSFQIGNIVKPDDATAQASNIHFKSETLGVSSWTSISNWENYTFTATVTAASTEKLVLYFAVNAKGDGFQFVIQNLTVQVVE